MTASTVLEPEWISATSSTTTCLVADERAARRQPTLGPIMMAVLLLTALVLWRQATDRPSSPQPEFVTDPPGALYLLPPNDGRFEPWRSGRIVTISSATAAAALDPDTPEPGAIHFEVADPWRPDGQAFAYDSALPSTSIRITYNSYTTVAGTDIHILTTTSTDPRAAVVPVGADIEAEEITLRGVRAWLVEDTSGPGAEVSVSWQVTPNHVAKVVGATAADEIRSVAESLERVSLNAWLTDRAFIVDHYDRQLQLWTCLTAGGVELSAPPDFDEYLRRDAVGRVWRIFDEASRDDTFWQAMEVCS